MPKFFQNEEFTYIKNKYVEENSYIGKDAKIIDLKLKTMSQEYYEKHYGTREKFINEFGRNYLD